MNFSEFLCDCPPCWWRLHPFKVVSVVRVATMTGRFSALAKCTYPQCPAPANALAEAYMHRTAGTVYREHPHWRAPQYELNESSQFWDE